MATLTPLYPTSDSSVDTDYTTSTGSTYFNLVDEAIASANDADYFQTSNNDNLFADFGLTDMPSDFVAMYTLTLTIRRKMTGLAGDTWAMTARIMNGATVLAAANSGGTEQSVWSITAADAGFVNASINFTYVNTAASKATWDGAVLETTGVRTANMGADAYTLQISAIEITGTYVKDDIEEWPILSSRSASSFGTGAYTSASFTPPPNSLVCVVGHVQTNGGSSDPSAAFTLANSASLSQMQRASIGSAESWSKSLRIWSMPAGSTPASMTVSLDCGANDIWRYCVSVVAYTGYDTSTPIGATATEFDTTPASPQAITLSAAPSSTSFVLAGLGYEGGTSAAAASSFTELYEVGADGDTSLQTQGRTSSTSDQVSWTLSGSMSWTLAAAIEINAAVGATNIALSPATITVTPTAPGLTPGTSSRALTPATITVTPVAPGRSAGAVSCALSPASVTVTGVALARTATASLAVTPPSVTVTPVAVGITPGTSSPVLSPATVTVTGSTLGAAPGAAGAALSPATVTVTPVAPARTASRDLTLSPPAITVTAQSLASSPGAASPGLSPATITVTPAGLARTATRTLALAPAIVSLTPSELTIVTAGGGAQTIDLNPATVQLVSQALGLTPGGASAVLSAATVTVTPTSLGSTSGGVTRGLSPATVTVVGQALDRTPGDATPALTPVAITVTASGLTVTNLTLTDLRVRTSAERPDQTTSGQRPDPTQAADRPDATTSGRRPDVTMSGRRAPVTTSARRRST